jgi:ferredoxin
MAIPTSRAKEAATIIVDENLCNGCGLCVKICSDNSLVLFNGKAAVNENPFFGCVGCGHCMAICPENALHIVGRTMQASDLFELPVSGESTNFNQLYALFQRRRSIRNFKDKAVDPEFIEQILDAARTAPMGLPPSDVHVVVFDSKDKANAFARDYCAYLQSMRWFVSDWFLALMRPFWGKANDEMFKGFIKPLFKTYIGGMKLGQNLVNYDPPLLFYFYGSPYTDPADPIVAATFAMQAAEALGLGTCMLGGVHPLIQNGKKAKKLREKYNIKYTSREGLFLAVGYPSFRFRKGIPRSFADISFV